MWVIPRKDKLYSHWFFEDITPVHPWITDRGLLQVVFRQVQRMEALHPLNLLWCPSIGGTPKHGEEIRIFLYE